MKMFFENQRWIFILTIMLCFSVLQSNAKTNDHITIKIITDKNTPSQDHTLVWEKGLSVLEALQHIAEVSTHPMGDYVFVTSINDVVGVPNKKVWYYTVNGKSPGKLAINRQCKKGDVICWIYKKDVCSGKKCN